MAGLTKEQRAAKLAATQNTNEVGAIIKADYSNDNDSQQEAKQAIRKPDCKHVQFHAGVDAMGSGLSVTNERSDIFMETAGVRIIGKGKNSGKKFFVPYTNIRGIKLL